MGLIDSGRWKSVLIIASVKILQRIGTKRIYVDIQKEMYYE